MKSARRFWVLPLAFIIAAIGLTIATFAGDVWPRKPPRRQIAVPGGNPDKGHLALTRYGCAACHIIPGLRAGRTASAPPLIDFSERATIAGTAENNPANLVKWIVNPTSVRRTATMPNVGVTEQDALHIAAYLYEH